jgi:xanthine dehydrogenase YagS FAD-binding subunit
MSELASEPSRPTTTELRAGGTDLSERRRSGRSAGPVVDIADLTDLTGLTEITPIAGGVRIGALVTVAQVARELAAYPALAATAAALATPEIRTVATIGGNLLQHTRCAYYRNPAFDCLRAGGTGCPARDGLAHHGVADDRGPCIAPHPSSIGMALLTYDATVEVAGATRSNGPGGSLASPLGAVFGDGSDHHGLGDGEVLTAVVLPPPLTGERAAYERATSRRFAEWPLVEAVTRIVVTDGRITAAAVGAGGVAPVPLRLESVEARLIGQRPDPDVLAAAAEAATDGFHPLEQTVYKLPLLRATVLDVLQRAVAAP